MNKTHTYTYGGALIASTALTGAKPFGFTPSRTGATAPVQESTNPNANAGHEDSTRHMARASTAPTTTTPTHGKD